METYKKIKIEQDALRWFIFIIGALVCAYCGLLCIGVRHIVAELSLVTMAYVLLGINVWMFRLCWIAWTFLVYIYAVRICMVLYDAGIFGEYLDMAHYIAFCIGLILIMILLFKLKSIRNEKSNSQTDSEDASSDS